MLRRNFISLNAYIRKGRRYQINNLNFHLKKSDKEQQKSASRKKDNKQRSMNLDNKNNREKSNWKLWDFLKNQKKIDKPLAMQTKGRNKTQFTNIKNKRGVIITDSIDVKRLK